MTKILTLIPVKRNMHYMLCLKCFDQIMRMQSYFGKLMDVYLDSQGPGDAEVEDFEGMGRISNLCMVRQSMVNEYLRDDHSHVLILDADVMYKPENVEGLLRTAEHNDQADPNRDIIAPAVLGEGETVHEWYDTWGFITEKGKTAYPFPPYFAYKETVIPMKCVGTMYLAPAQLFRDGAKFEPVPGYVDHFSICDFARNNGRRVWCNMNVVVRHPRLKNFGEKREK